MKLLNIQSLSLHSKNSINACRKCPNFYPLQTRGSSISIFLNRFWLLLVFESLNGTEKCILIVFECNVIKDANKIIELARMLFSFLFLFFRFKSHDQKNDALVDGMEESLNECARELERMREFCVGLPTSYESAVWMKYVNALWTTALSPVAVLCFADENHIPHVKWFILCCVLVSFSHCHFPSISNIWFVVVVVWSELPHINPCCYSPLCWKKALFWWARK